jgi:hypothetical protein
MPSARWMAALLEQQQNIVVSSLDLQNATYHTSYEQAVRNLDNTNIKRQLSEIHPKIFK